ncbi:MAG: hypothetical protein AB7N70_32200 [Dehalococcoidia bacterium]
MRRAILTTLAAFAFALTGGTLHAQTQQQQQQRQTMSFSNIDQDNNGQVSKDEFYGYVGDAGVYGDLDTDRDGFIDSDELDAIGFEQGFADFDLWDADQNDHLDATEFYDGVYEGFDGDESGHWDGTEWDDAGDAGIFDI